MSVFNQDVIEFDQSYQGHCDEFTSPSPEDLMIAAEEEEELYAPVVIKKRVVKQVITTPKKVVQPIKVRNSTMNTVDTFTFIVAAITRMAERNVAPGKSAAMPAFAIQVLDLMGHGHSPAASIILVTAERMKTAEVLRRRGDKHLVTEKPEAVMGFMEQVMNQVCWSARSVNTIQERGNPLQDLTDLANGYDIHTHQDVPESTSPDFVGDRLAELGLPNLSTEAVQRTVEDDFNTLATVHSQLLTAMSYMVDVMPLAFYVQKEQRPEGWVVTAEAHNWDDALKLMEGSIDELSKESSNGLIDLAASIDSIASKSTGIDPLTAPLYVPDPSQRDAVHGKAKPAARKGFFARVFGN